MYVGEKEVAVNCEKTQFFLSNLYKVHNQNNLINSLVVVLPKCGPPHGTADIFVQNNLNKHIYLSYSIMILT